MRHKSSRCPHAAVDESNRTATPLELLFDLTSSRPWRKLAALLAHDVASGHATTSIGPFLMVFFAIWWAWMNFTWFASAYDSDDVAYRLAAFVQMGGVLVLAAGVDARSTTRLRRGHARLPHHAARAARAWLRARDPAPSWAPHSPAIRQRNRPPGGALAQSARLGGPLRRSRLSWLCSSLSCWCRRGRNAVARPPGTHTTSQSGIPCSRSSCSARASSPRLPPWSPSSSARLTPTSSPCRAPAWSSSFALWWLYFAAPAGAGLAARREWSYVWGYGHYLFFAALAALGAGLEVAVAASAGHAPDLPPWGAVAAVATPVALVLAMIELLQIPAVGDRPRLDTATTLALIALAAVVMATDRIGLAAGLCVVAGIVTSVVVADLVGSAAPQS